MESRLSTYCLALLATLVLTVGCDTSTGGGIGQQPAKKADTASTRPFDVEGLRPQVVAFCADCHGMPAPSAYTKKQWVQEVARGFEFYRTSGRYDLEPPRESSVVAFFQAQAPDEIVFDVSEPSSKPLGVTFRRQVLARPKGTEQAAVADLLWRPARDGKPGRLLFSDMFLGDFNEIQLPAEELTATKLAALGHPAIIEPADLDADGREEFLVGDLGSFLPQDHRRGRVLWLRQLPDGAWGGDALAAGLGRVSQAASGDFDGDGDGDVVVAEFGWRKTGRTLLLRRAGGDGNPRYDVEVVDPRHGPSHVRPIDWDGDGDLDFIALISQEFEKVELFVNDGQGRFQIQTLFAAEDPAFGFSGIDLVDFDGDGDTDVLLTNGDSMDSDTLKPSHAVRWLENQGKQPLVMHPLTAMPGAYQAVSGDIDGDGDRDVVAIGFPPLGSNPESWVTHDLLVVLEQTAPGEFARHVLPEPVGGAALVMEDFDADGDLDLATGAFHKGEDQTWVTVWWNEGK